jgi:hypothetical protein
VAGQINHTGSTNPLLVRPEGIYVDKINRAVYVVDAAWHRVQKWPKDAQEGITVAGSSIGAGNNNPDLLLSPSSVFVDAKIIYI